MQRKESIKINIHTQIAEDSEKKCCGCWENYVLTTKENDRIKCEICRNLLHKFSSAHKQKSFDGGRRFLQ